MLRTTLTNMKGQVGHALNKTAQEPQQFHIAKRE